MGAKKRRRPFACGVHGCKFRYCSLKSQAIFKECLETKHHLLAHIVYIINFLCKILSQRVAVGGGLEMPVSAARESAGRRIEVLSTILFLDFHCESLYFFFSGGTVEQFTHFRLFFIYWVVAKNTVHLQIHMCVSVVIFNIVQFAVCTVMISQISDLSRINCDMGVVDSVIDRFTHSKI